MIPGMDFGGFMGSGSGHSLQGGNATMGDTSLGDHQLGGNTGDAFFVNTTPESAPIWAGFMESSVRAKNTGFDMNQALLIGAGLVALIVFMRKRG